MRLITLALLVSALPALILPVRAQVAAPVPLEAPAASGTGAEAVPPLSVGEIPVPGDPEPVIPEKETESDETVVASPPWHDALLALPDWIPSEWKEILNERRPANHGGGLFPGEVWPLEAEAPQGPLEWPPEMPLALPVNGEALPPPEVLSPAQVAALFGRRPDGVLVDPQQLIPPDRVAAVEGVVRKWMHDESAFPATVVLLGPTQQLPPDFDPLKIHTDWFGSENALLVLYFYQRPERTLAFFSREARATWGDTQLRKILDAAVEEAGRMPGPVEQLERFCYKSAVRLYWLPRTGVRQTDPVAAAENVAAAGGSRGLILGLAGAVCAGLAGAGTVWYRRRVRAAAAVPLYFPEQDLHPRLGAAHSGGFSSTLQFGAPAKRL